MEVIVYVLVSLLLHFYAFGALMLLVWRQDGHLAFKN